MSTEENPQLENFNREMPDLRVDFDEWFRAYGQELIRWLRSRLKDDDAAKDVAQMAFVYLWRYSRRTPISHPKALLFKVAAWLACNENRRATRLNGHFMSTWDMLEASPQCDLSCNERSPEEAAFMKQWLEMAFRTIDSMPKKAQTAFKLHRFQELTYDQIADEMQVSKSSVEKYMIQALKQIRSTLSEAREHFHEA